MTLQEALDNPAAMFTSPQAVCNCGQLSRIEKRGVLLRWEEQLQQGQTGDNEAADARDHRLELRRLVSAALAALGSA